MTAVVIYAAIAIAVGLIAGALLGLRTPDHVIKQREIGKRAGKTLISVRTYNAGAAEQAMTILKQGGAEEVHQKVE